MKVAVTAENSTTTSPVDPRFGRAAYLAIVDTESGAFEVCDNTQASAMSHGAGPQVARKMADLGVEAVITGNVGPNAFEALRAVGIEVYLVYAGTVDSVIERLRTGRIEKAVGPSRKGHD